MEQFKLVAKTFQGLEDVLAQELTQLGATDVEKGIRMVSFTGDKQMMYKANFCLRTALRILKPIHEFQASDADEVYNAVHQIDWHKYLDLKTSFAVDSVVYSEDFRHSKFVAYKVKDAIVDYFRENDGQRPNISVANPDIRLNIHISGKECTLSLDSSGESLHKRGYRVATVESPINEVLAAGMLMLTGWQGEKDLIDPMCGSGTIAVEAALLARNIYPGIFHQGKYAFENWPDFDADLLQSIYDDDSQERSFTHKIYARDIDPVAVGATTRNARSAGVLDCIDIAQQPFQQFHKPEQPAIMVMNPPYGERISAPNLSGLYRTIGEKLKHQFTGNDAWIISYHKETFDMIGLKPSLVIPLYNGALPCEFRKYQLFDGKLKGFRQEGGELKTDEERRRNFEKRPLKPRRQFRANNDDDDENDDIPAYMVKRHRDFVSRQGGGHDSNRERHRDRQQDYRDRQQDFGDRQRNDGPRSNSYKGKDRNGRSGNGQSARREGHKSQKHARSPWAKGRDNSYDD